jgi:hypothetical protein
MSPLREGSPIPDDCRWRHVFTEGVCLPDLLSLDSFTAPWAFFRTCCGKFVYAQGISEEVSVNYDGLIEQETSKTAQKVYLSRHIQESDSRFSTLQVLPFSAARCLKYEATSERGI